MAEVASTSSFKLSEHACTDFSLASRACLSSSATLSVLQESGTNGMWCQGWQMLTPIAALQVQQRVPLTRSLQVVQSLLTSAYSLFSWHSGSGRSSWQGLQMLWICPSMCQILAMANPEKAIGLLFGWTLSCLMACEHLPTAARHLCWHCWLQHFRLDFRTHVCSQHHVETLILEIASHRIMANALCKGA